MPAAAASLQPGPPRIASGRSAAASISPSFAISARCGALIAGITGFAAVAGDRHSFWAGYAAKALPPAAFETPFSHHAGGGESHETIKEGGHEGDLGGAISISLHQ